MSDVEEFYPSKAFRKAAILLTALAAVVPAQTRVDLKWQSKAIDFTSLPATKPLAMGASLPAICGVGELFFLSSAPVGMNVYGCAPANTWTLSGAAVTAIQNSGQTIGSRSTLDFYSGPGIFLATSDTGQKIAIQADLDTAFVQTRAGEQSGTALFCPSVSDDSASNHTCALTPTLTAYAAGMVLHWKPDKSTVGGPVSINVDLLGSVAVKLGDGVTDPGPGDVSGGRLQQIWYDGSVFRLDGRRLPGSLGEVQPDCGASLRGGFWFVPHLSGSKDEVNVCAKDASDNYAWRTIY